MTGRASSRWTSRGTGAAQDGVADVHADASGRAGKTDPRALADLLDDLPRNETFDWVDRVSIELTTQMLATLFDFPWEERRKLTRWSDVATALPEERHRRLDRRAPPGRAGRVLRLFVQALERARQRRAAQRPDLDDGAQRRHAGHGPRWNIIGNIILLIVGGNDTTRNTITGSVLALNENPDQYDKLRANPALIDSMVPEMIRWQTPLAHMRRTALQDTEIGGKTSRRATRSSCGTSRATATRRCSRSPTLHHRPRRGRAHHLSFGFGIHRCVGMRLAELQLQDRLGRDAEALRPHRGGRRAQADLFELREGLRVAAGEDSGVGKRLP